MFESSWAVLPGRVRLLRGTRAHDAGQLLLVLALAGAPAAAAQEEAALLAAVHRLRGDVALLAQSLRERDESFAGLRREVQGLAEDVRLVRDRVAALGAQPFMAAAFLASPPAPSDTVGVAKVPVFAPRLNVDSVRRHDTLFLKLRRIEPGGVPLVAELELHGGEPAVDLPVDRNGALYVLEWSTAEGFTYTLSLRDGASGQTAASVEVRPLSNQGRFLFVGSRLD